MKRPDRTPYGIARLARLALFTMLAGCGAEGGLEIVEPERGRVVEGPRVTVRWRVPADLASGDHVHVFLDRDLPAVGEPIPHDDPRIVHVVGDSSHTFDGVEPGPHRVTVVVGDAAHRVGAGFSRASVAFRVADRP